MDFDEALRDQGCKVGSVGTAGGNPLLHNVDNCAVQALLCIVSSGVGGLPSGMALISAGRFDLNISSVCHGRSRE